MWGKTEESRENMDTRLSARKMPNAGWRIMHVASGTIVGKGASFKSAVDDARRLLGIIEDSSIKRTVAVPGSQAGDHG